MPAQAALGRPNPMLGTVERKPQSTAEPVGGGPFTRHSRRARLTAFDLVGQAFSALVVQPLKPVGGYLRTLDLLIKASGGSGTGTSGVKGTAIDSPYSAIATLILRDAFGQPVIQTDGWGLRLIDMYGAQAGFWTAADPANLPSFSDVATTGNFTVRFRIPIELLSNAFCSLPSMNAASQPTLQLNLAAAASVYQTSPAPTLPTFEVRVEENYWAVPLDDPSLAPPGVGSSAPWSQSLSPSSIASQSLFICPLPRVGTWIHTLILQARDSGNVRVDTPLPDPIDFWVDGTPYFSEPLDRRKDLMFEQTGLTRPTGCVVYSFRDSIQAATSEADTGDEWLHTTPGTLLEFRGTAGTIASAPASLYAYTGEVYPLGSVPYEHLAQ